MDEILSLLNKGEFEKVLEATKDKDSPEYIYYKIAALTGLSREKEALELLLANRDSLWGTDPQKCIKWDLELRLSLDQFDEAYEDEKYFQNKPYVSQKVEESLREIIPSIRAYERAKYAKKEAGKDSIKDILLDEQAKDFAILQALYEVKSEDKSLIKEIRAIANSNRHDTVRTFALLKLLDLSDVEPLTFTKNGKSYNLVPAKMNPPYTGEEYKAFIKKLLSSSKDVSMLEAARSLYDSYVLDLYPEIDPEDDLLLLGLIYLASSYLSSPISSEVYKHHSLSIEDIKAKAESIEKVIEANPPLAY